MSKIIGIGNALTDILLQVDSKSILEQLNLPSGSMQLVDEAKQKEISLAVKEKQSVMATGGSAANTVNGVARLGHKAAFIGKVGDDEVGKFYADDLEKNGVEPLLTISETPSGRCLVLILPDGERTMCTYLGAAATLESSEVNTQWFSSDDIFHIEGYLVQSGNLLTEVAGLVQKINPRISIDLASYNVVEDNLEIIHNFVEKFVDIVFANEDEARAFSGKNNPLEALDFIASMCKIAIVKTGKAGSYVKANDKVYKIEGVKANCVDTTGAGDLYAAGFLYGLANDFDLEKCGKIGSLVAGNIVEVVGAKMEQARWDKIKSQIEKL